MSVSGSVPGGEKGFPQESSLVLWSRHWSFDVFYSGTATGGRGDTVPRTQKNVSHPGSAYVEYTGEVVNASLDKTVNRDRITFMGRHF